MPKIVHYGTEIQLNITKSFTKSLKLELKSNNSITNLLKILTYGLKILSDMLKQNHFVTKK